MLNSEICQKALALLTRRHVQLGVLETDEKDESLRGYCICGALLKAVDWKEPIGPLVTRLNVMIRDILDNMYGDISEFSENAVSSNDVGHFMYHAVTVFLEEEANA